MEDVVEDNVVAHAASNHYWQLTIDTQSFSTLVCHPIDLNSSLPNASTLLEFK